MSPKSSNIAVEKSVRDALKQSEEKYRMLLEMAVDAFFQGDQNGRFIMVNDNAIQLTGYSREELLSMNIRDLFPPDILATNPLRYDLLATGKTIKVERAIIHKNGRLMQVEMHSKAMPDGTYQSFFRDITERGEAEEALRASEEKFRSIVESSPTAMHFYRLDRENNLVMTGANPAADTILGIAHAPLVGLPILEAFPNLAETEIPGMYRKVAAGEIGPQSFEIPYSDERFSGFYIVHVFKTGSRTITVDFSDITTRRQTEEALQRSEIEYRDTLDSLPDWIYVVDEQYKIAMVNAALKQEMVRHGLTPDCIGIEIIPDFPFISTTTLDEIRNVFTTGNVSISEQRIELKGKTLHGEITRVPILKDGKVVKVILMIRDRSKEKEIEELKQRSTEQKEVLLREIHHRVKNNLAIVISLLNFQLRNNTNDELTKMIIDIQMRIRSMALIHEHLYRSENLDRIPLASYIDSLAYMIMTAFSGHRITLVKELEPMDASIETALPIGLMINELLTNAFKYAFPGGAQGNIRISLEKDELGMCTLVVEDNGVGLPATSSMDSEKSIGLYIVRLLVEQLEGTVHIDREKGTTFRIRFLNLISRRKKEQLHG
ncbi:MAG: PAS domain S-box protein [Bacteroidales bacterium]